MGTVVIVDSALPFVDINCGTVTSPTAPDKPIGLPANPINQTGGAARLSEHGYPP